MKNEILKILSFCLIITSLFFFYSCNEGNKKSADNDALTSGKLTVYCDEALYNLMETAFKLHDSTFPDVKLTRIKVNAREAMAKLLSANSEVIIIARDYLKDEDSLMIAYKVKEHPEMICAEDALVFYTLKSFPLDTLSQNLLSNILINNQNLSSYFPGVKNEPRFVINNYSSSEYANFVSLVTKKKNIKKKLTMFTGSDSVINYVKNNPGTIGIGYLSQIAKDTSLKGIKISYLDSAGKYIFPHTVHQANVLRRNYPFIVPIRVYLLQDLKNKAFWFGMFLSKEGKVQKYFLDAGIVPVYAQIKLVEQD
ncbi:MAG: substrate-binding domain-containing protein [Ignavibacteriae bacterium]|nr:substrate-binding domain-containing protein [Ignavibacteriota bacterium]